MIKYLGSKRLLLSNLLACLHTLKNEEDAKVLDLFSGTARVGHALKKAGYHVIANDHNTYAATLATCYVQADAEKYTETAQTLLHELQQIPPKAGFFTETYCIQSRFFHPKNGEKIDAIRDAIEAKDLDPTLKAVLLVSLMEAADRVDSTTGVQMAYLKQWAARAHNDLALRLPAILPGKGQANQGDALDAAKEFPCDIAYLDPPYNQHSYLGNYHIWETLVRWDQPEVYGVACKRIQCKTHKSPFNAKRQALPALRAILEALQAKHIVISFNNEGYIAQEEMEALLCTFGAVRAVAFDFKRYVGAQIGIYNPSGEKVGDISHLRNQEILYIVSPDAATAERAAQAALSPLQQALDLAS